jgi:hypothetical protein
MMKNKNDNEDANDNHNNENYNNENSDDSYSNNTNIINTNYSYKQIKNGFSVNLGYYLINEKILKLKLETFYDKFKLDYQNPLNFTSINATSSYGARGIVGLGLFLIIS